VDVLDHVGVNCSDLPTAAAFYDKVLGALGFSRLMDFDVAIGYGSSKPDFWISVQPPEGPASGPNREIHVAFQAGDAAAVRAFHDAAVSLGAEVLHEPRFWPEYHEGYYGAFVRDPDGNNVEAVCHSAQPGDDLPA
jgi:catechol 2,3-dioxygenase-like lactoylglutathione lyase family enzyme